MKNLLVVDLDKVPSWLALDLKTIGYTGILNGETLRHLAYLADEREQRDAEKLVELLYGAEL